ncbi:MAG: alpha/beta hydrolase [Deltaproteobacteria bacterium]|nr:alpha/beta hydrolase [Deltaproteobacteria bacterium]
MRAPIEASVAVNGVSLTYFEWGRGAAGDPLLLVHATGFHARCWDQVVRQLGRRLGRRRVIAIDQRGHGRSDKVDAIRWREFGRDVAEIARRLDLRGVVGVGHSAGGHAMVEAAAIAPTRFRRLVLVDPTIMAPEHYAARGAAEDGAWIRVAGATHPAAKRRRHFTSIDEMIERLHGRPSFASFTAAALRDYCTWGLVPSVDPPGFELACTPEMESAVYGGAFGNPGIHEHVRALDLPVTLLRAIEPRTPADLADFRYSPTWPALASQLRRSRDVHRPDRTHFMPMEDPALVASVIAEAEAQGG